MFELIKKYCRMGLYKDADLDKFVLAGTLTQAQVAEIRAALPTSGQNENAHNK